MKRSSLRARLLWLLLGGTGAVWVAAAIVTFYDARYHVGRLFDAQLTAYSEVLGALVGHEIYEISDHPAKLDAAYAQSCTYQIFSYPAGMLLLRSESAPKTPLSGAEGFADVQADGKRWRVHRRVDQENQVAIVVAHDVAERESLVRDIAMRLVLPLLLAVPLIGIALWLAVSRSLRPLERLAGQLHGRHAGQLHPLAVDDAPSEVRPLVDALDQLFGRVERSFENERRFTGDAAHELRTPLAAVKTQAEVALATASEERRGRALQQVVAAADRATGLVQQLLMLARLDADAPRAFDRIDLLAVVRDAVHEMQPEADGKEIRIESRADAARDWHAAGEPQMLHALLRNLLENALRHTPPGGQVEVALEDTGQGIELAIEDSGPGVPEALRERIFDRLYRAPGSEGGASGLGLSIARRVVELHRGTIAARRSEHLGGLSIIVWLPR